MSLEKLNLPLFIGLSSTGDEAIELMLKNNFSMEMALYELSQHFKIRITFSEPVEIRTVRRTKVIKEEKDATGRVISITRRHISSTTGTRHVFHGFYYRDGLWYQTRRTGRKIYRFPFQDKIVFCEPGGLN